MNKVYAIINDDDDIETIFSDKENAQLYMNYLGGGGYIIRDVDIDDMVCFVNPPYLSAYYKIEYDFAADVINSYWKVTNIMQPGIINDNTGHVHRFIFTACLSFNELEDVIKNGKQSKVLLNYAHARMEQYTQFQDPPMSRENFIKKYVNDKPEPIRVKASSVPAVLLPLLRENTNVIIEEDP